MKFTHLFIPLGLVFLTIACKKNPDSEPSNGNILFKKTSIQVGQTDTVFTFYAYQSDGQLKSTDRYSITNPNIYRDVYTYGVNNRLESVTSYLITKQIPDSFYTMQAYYDNAGRITRVKSITYKRDYTPDCWSFTYDNLNRLVADSVHEKWDQKAYGYNNYIYASNGNLSTIEHVRYDYVLQKFVTNWTENFKYDNYTNPNVAFKWQYAIDGSFLTNTALNNRIETSYYISKYKYQSNGLPYEEQIFTKQDNVLREIQRMYYK